MSGRRRAVAGTSSSRSSWNARGSCIGTPGTTSGRPVIVVRGNHDNQDPQTYVPDPAVSLRAAGSRAPACTRVPRTAPRWRPSRRADAGETSSLKPWSTRAFSRRFLHRSAARSSRTVPAALSWAEAARTTTPMISPSTSTASPRLRPGVQQRLVAQLTDTSRRTEPWLMREAALSIGGRTTVLRCRPRGGR